jgi:hypothetical protein
VIPGPASAHETGGARREERSSAGDEGAAYGLGTGPEAVEGKINAVETASNPEEIHANPGEVHSDAGEIDSNDVEVNSNSGEINPNSGEVNSNPIEINSNRVEIHSNAAEVDSTSVEGSVQISVGSFQNVGDGGFPLPLPKRSGLRPLPEATVYTQRNQARATGLENASLTGSPSFLSPRAAPDHDFLRRRSR